VYRECQGALEATTSLDETQKTPEADDVNGVKTACQDANEPFLRTILSFEIQELAKMQQQYVLELVREI
jgi:hypothetical protein